MEIDEGGGKMPRKKVEGFKERPEWSQEQLDDGLDAAEKVDEGLLALTTSKQSGFVVAEGLRSGSLSALKLSRHTGLSKAECEGALAALAARGFLRQRQNGWWLIDERYAAAGDSLLRLVKMRWEAIKASNKVTG